MQSTSQKSISELGLMSVKDSLFSNNLAQSINLLIWSFFYTCMDELNVFHFNSKLLSIGLLLTSMYLSIIQIILSPYILRVLYIRVYLLEFSSLSSIPDNGVFTRHVSYAKIMALHQSNEKHQVLRKLYCLVRSSEKNKFSVIRRWQGALTACTESAYICRWRFSYLLCLFLSLLITKEWS